MAVGTARIARDIAFTLEVKSPKIFENIFLNNGVLCMLGAKGRVKIVRGGNRFDERVRLGQNSNVDHRNKFAEIPTDYQNNVRTAEYGHAVVSGAVPVNLVEIDQNSGSSAISNLAEDAVQELMNTFANKVAGGLMASSSTGTGPVSIVEELEATAFGSQTRTTGGIARSDYPGTGTDGRTAAWQTQYTNTSADLSAAAGLATMQAFLLTCSEGTGKMYTPDIFLTTNGVYSQISGNSDVLRRYSVNDKIMNLGFDNIMVGGATMIGDANVPAGYGYAINTNFMRVQVLAGPKTKRTGSVTVVGDGAVSVPIQVLAPVEAGNKLEYVVKAYMVYNLTPQSLKYHGLMDNLTEASA